MSAANAPTIDSMELDDENKFDIWDRRESAVSNGPFWASAASTYRSTSPLFAGGAIPHVLHQIWIGARQPPCVWLDTWRLDFMRLFASPSASGAPAWTYRLWDNASTQGLAMANRDIFDAEEMPQCQADILRLEVLYAHGGVYVDADIVSTGRDLRPALAAARDTGFMITYEPDTKDKPYSVLGNSLIAATPRHPLTLMLMAYVRRVYAAKRPYYGVEWVTGPLTYTKVLLHTGMHVYIPPSKDFYPAFHYVPDPSAIDVSKCDSYCFQFGYTCSGLSDWVANNNTCRNAHACSYHARVEYPLGKLRSFSSPAPAAAAADGALAAIPRVVHQFWLKDGCDGDACAPRPERWIATWRDEFCPRAGFAHELWTWARLRDEIGTFFCANLYVHGSRMDAHAIHLLALEVLHARGGYYVPLSTTFSPSPPAADAGGDASAAADAAAEELAAALQKGRGAQGAGGDGGDAHLLVHGSVVGTRCGGALPAIKKAYDCGECDLAPTATATASPDGTVCDGDNDHMVHMGFSDADALRAMFRDGSRFLGASAIIYAPTPDSGGDDEKRAGAAAALAWGYDCQVPVWNCLGAAGPQARQVAHALARSGGMTVVVTDAGFAQFTSLVDEIPGVLHRLGGHAEDDGAAASVEVEGWLFVVINVEWETDTDGMEVYVASSAFRAPNAHYLGFIANTSALPARHDDGDKDSGDDLSGGGGIDGILSLHATGRVLIASQKSRHSRTAWRLFSSMPHVQLACERLSGHAATFARDAEEVHDNVFKGFADSQVAFEVQVDDEGRVMYRAWSGGGVVCECRVRPRAGGVQVENLRCFDGGTVLTDVAGEFVSF